MHTMPARRIDSLDLLLRRSTGLARGARTFALALPGGETAPLWLGLGAAAALAGAAVPAGLALGVAAGAFLGFLALRGRLGAAIWLSALSLLALGHALTGLRIAGAAPPSQVLALRQADVIEGWIEAVQRSASGRERLLIRLDEPGGGFRVRVIASRGVFEAGDRVRVRARLSPFPGPAVPGGYDPAHRAWFDRIVFTGYAVAPLEAAEETGGDRLARQLARTRFHLAERVRMRAGEETGGLIAALLTGDRSGVSPEQTEALRASGLGHLLAISGLHMALFSGGAFFLARLCLASWPAFARANDPAPHAAVIALLAAAVYLALSGAAVSTQRAFIMSAAVLTAVILRRRAISMRGLAAAALLVLLIAPESVAEPGFQMSFAAAGALVAAYEAVREYRSRRLRDGARSRLSALAGWFGALALTSLVAGLATGAFSAMHFNRLAGWGLAANLAAMPVFSMVVMPSAALGLALTPLGLDLLPLQAAAKGMEGVLAIAVAAAEAPGAVVRVAAPSGWIAALYAAGFAIAVLAPGATRALGAGMAAGALLLWAAAPQADVFIAEDGTVIARTGAGWAIMNGSPQAYDAAQFLQRAGADPDALLTAARCDPGGCVLTGRSGVRIATAFAQQSLEEDCRRADVVVTLFPATPHLRRMCRAYLLDPAERARRGGVVLNRTADGGLNRRSAREERPAWLSDKGG